MKPSTIVVAVVAITALVFTAAVALTFAASVSEALQALAILLGFASPTIVTLLNLLKTEKVQTQMAEFMEVRSEE